MDKGEEGCPGPTRGSVALKSDYTDWQIEQYLYLGCHECKRIDASVEVSDGNADGE